MKPFSGLFLLAVIAVPAAVYQIQEVNTFQLQTALEKDPVLVSQNNKSFRFEDEEIKSPSPDLSQDQVLAGKLTQTSMDQDFKREKAVVRGLVDQNGTKGERLTPLQQINLMKASDWMEVKGIGEVTSQRIVHLREEKGGFDSLENLLEVKGIGPAKYDAILAWLKIE
ncbi:ComEA family DNA-binding protein [Acidaminobacter hydrogenoformans]|uniref:Helix-hairpin-helix motif-containing protein n=1 Tax=Acidaminobacter hydrogenoformans DSM 2784 TaxID=1120920 RepID=A0A1G5RV34_9FIRM|nr:helix-hairpin-helix domain-containing protein [Acidaminobacter hydrogenoformans]SCZ77189.1 Helix-hairpin-helix motif-containing protein [Acidaminobacter hydrogenoformans DSM 2784]